MEEEDICLPKNHPLQQYLQEIGISDAVSCEISRKSITLPLTTFYQFLSYLKWINPFAFLFNFGFDFPLIRKLLLQNINLIRYSDLITVENKPVVEYVCSTGIKYQIDPTQFRWFSVIFFMLCGLGLNYCTYMTITVLLAILSLLMPNILLLMASKHYLTDTLKQMKKFTQGSRLIVLFLQDLNKRRYFGPKIVDKSAFKIFPLIYHQAHNFMQTYLIGLINFSVRLGDLIDKDSLSMPLEMSTLELFQLKRDLEDKPIDPNIEDLKMFCELLKVLISDILVKLSITFCKRRWSTFHSLQLTISVWKWECFLNGIKDEFDKLSELHSMISSGKLTNSNHDIVNSHIPEHNETTVLHKPEARITRELLLHLLVAVEHANNLKSYVEQNSDISFVTNEIFSKLVNLVHCQLNASMIFLNELDIIQATDKVDLPKGDLETTNVDFSYCRDGISPSKNFLPAEDPIVEDDVLDDIAVGNSSSHESEAEYENDNMDSLKNPSTSMHISVLKELKNAISHRRIIMQEREECALRRRLQIDRPYDEKPNLSTNDNINLSSEMELQSQFSLSSTPYATNQNNFVTMNEKLSNFFPTSSSYNSTYKVNKQYYSTDRNLQSNVLKRNTIFHYLSSSIHHKNDKNAKYTNSFILNNDLLSTKLSNNSLLQQSTLTTILMNQRKLLGFTKEDYFTGIGLGESCIEISQETNSPTS